MGERAGGKALDDLRLERPVLLLYAAADLGLAREPWQMGSMTQSMPVFLGMSHGDCLGTSVKDLFSTRMLKIIRPTVVRISRAIMACFGEDPFKHLLYGPASLVRNELQPM